MIVRKTKIRKLGNSQGIIVPSDILESLQFFVGQEIEIVIDGDALVISKPVPSLEELVASVPKDRKLKEVATGARVGKEEID